ncbi:unnamed protein product [Parascedosporium putredinis]|uniref:Xylose isomerase-like TIM barrel domain-containing protein n=1 Tax=Parascedosporium putredinis TaxID=1442378 RepID=A0A9P1GX94_9PEZI|nr:unnamed protein product [Parascedosporium putredinis]CAI7989610.1 unnamed protein product [Parascedosporium putredinis]
MVTRVDRPNFGMCIDTFNLTGRVYADPASPTGKTPNADRDMAESMQRLVERVDADKIFFVQMGDAARLAEPIRPGHELYDAAQPARMSWSRQHRLFYGEQHLGGYLPVKDVMVAVLRGVGYRGWVSYEIFNHRLFNTDASIPDEMARRAAVGFDKMVKDVFGPVARPMERPADVSRSNSTVWEQQVSYL